MEIRLSFPDLFFDLKIVEATTSAKCYARIKWTTPVQCRFVLVAKAMSKDAATFEQHDEVIRALLVIDPEAVVRTARATYEGLTDFDAQKAARVPIETEAPAPEAAGDLL